MKKILIVSKVFFPENSPRANRTTELAKEFSRQGYDVTVCIPDLMTTDLNENPEFSNIKFVSLGKSKYQKVSGKSILGRFLVRFSKMIFEYPDIQLVNMISKTLKKLNGYDLLISIAVPHPIHWGVNKAIKQNKLLTKCWIADCGDPYMGCRTDSFKKLFYFKYIEKAWCKVCNYIAIPHEAMIVDYYSEFESKIKVIPQGFNLDEYTFDTYLPNKIPTFAYAGVLSEKFRNPLPLINYLNSLNIDFKFIVYTKSTLLDNFKNDANKKIEIRSYIPRAELLNDLSKMDFLINFENCSIQKSLNKTVENDIIYSTPSKIIDYSIVNRPVLSVSNELNFAVINQFLSGDYSNKQILPDLSRFDIKNIVNQFLNLTDIKI